MKLTDTQRRALSLCANRPTRAILPGHQLTRLDMSYTTALHLMVCTYTQSIPRPLDEPVNVAGIYVITTAGRAALTVPIPDTPVYLSARMGGMHGDYTTVAALGAKHEPEAVPRDQTASWSSEAIQNRDLTQQAEWHRQLTRLEVTTKVLSHDVANRPDVLHEIELIERRIASIRRKLAAYPTQPPK